MHRVFVICKRMIILGFAAGPGGFRLYWFYVFHESYELAFDPCVIRMLDALSY